MKKKTAILILTFICLFNTSYSQTKTPYEKKEEEISIKYLKKMRVSSSEINRAKSADESGMLLLLLIAEKIQAYQYTHGVESLILMNEWEKEIKAAEKLKGKADYKKEREKSEKAKREKIARQKKYEQQKLLEEKKAEEKKIVEEKKQEREQLEYLIKNSDLNKVKSSIRKSFITWVAKGDYESTEEHLLRLDNKYKILDSLCFYNINNLIKNRNNIRGNEDNFYLVKLFKYNADKKFYPIELRLESGWGRYDDEGEADINISPSTSILDTIYVEVALAKKLISNAKFDDNDNTYNFDFSNNLTFSNNISEWFFDEMGYLFPKSFSLMNDEFKHQIKYNLKTADNMSISTSNLTLDEYFKNDYISNTHKYYEILIDKKRNTILKNANKLLSNGELENAKKMFLAANKLKYSEDVNDEIKNIENKLIELNKLELIIKAEQYYTVGNISKSIETFEQANKLKESIELNQKITNIKKNLLESYRLHDNLDSLFNIIDNEKQNLFKDIVDVHELENYKKGYSEKYISCKQKITENVDSEWKKILNIYNEINRNREIFEDRFQNIFEELNKFKDLINKNSNFEKEIQKALLSKNKKYLKILKEDNIYIIIETVTTSLTNKSPTQ
jgi:hypothetical protein